MNAADNHNFRFHQKLIMLGSWDNYYLPPLQGVCHVLYTEKSYIVLFLLLKQPLALRRGWAFDGVGSPVFLTQGLAAFPLVVLLYHGPMLTWVPALLKNMLLTWVLDSTVFIFEKTPHFYPTSC